jgi:RNA polymerase sigma-70 factor (ECF subfamily)
MNEKEFSDVYRNYRDVVYGFAFTLWKDNAAAKDVMQDVFMKLWEIREGFYTEKCIEGYLRTMVRNKFITWKRRLAIMEEYSNHILWHNESAKPDDPVLTREIKLLEYQAIEKLPPRERTVYMARRYGFGKEEISRLLNVSKCTIARQIAVSRKKVRKHVKNKFSYPLKEAA